MNTAAATPVLTIPREPVVSSNLKAVGYDAATQTLDVEFNSGRVYRYRGVPPEAHKAFVNAESIGKHFGQHIRTKFPYFDLDEAEVHEGSTPD